jgi:hypothetical protein
MCARVFAQTVTNLSELMLCVTSATSATSAEKMLATLAGYLLCFASHC